MPFEFSVSDIVPASAQEIYDAWLSSSGHEKMTGGKPAQISPRGGAEFTVWNDYITGRNLKLEPPRRLVQSWRTTKFARRFRQQHGPGQARRRDPQARQAG